ncbi:MAG: FGGY-family carbohydrate kinase, partial [Phormidesmis sp.]
GQIIDQAHCSFSPSSASDPATWKQALWALIEEIAPSVRTQIKRIAINGTSATVVLCDRHAKPLTSALMYDNAIARDQLPALRDIVPADSPACGPILSATSSLAKALWWHRNLAATDPDKLASASYIAHQADWLASLLHGQPAISDYHNALKLGYDVRAMAYPDWLLALPVAQWLPEVREPGEAIAPILTALSDRFGFPSDCQICAGTTDSIAAFLASNAHSPGEAVTSLGSTLVLKLLSPTPIDHSAFGIYSHRLGDLWLVGGASNTGGAILQRFFSPAQLTELSQEIAQQIDISSPPELDYYPLNAPGERFPINDPDYPPRLTPRPAKDRDFLWGLLDAIARIEADGYQKLNDLGAPRLQRVYTAGGGARNLTWQALRQRRLNVSVSAAFQTDAAYGTAQLAIEGLSRFKGV